MADSARRSALLPVSVVMFALGLLAIVAIFVLFALGYQDLPVWLNLTTLLCPVGLAVGVVGAIATARRR
ncbi:hypothetical protein [Saccharopolyspora hordei]|uniref:Nitrogen fixation-related uncharacterized protein n=1 Tax=Saccharopolyspora hordei TaxID=1838 RepID=A0A853ANM0_9PSEU|nr:hypothetical protein [Saccharopolyspora hordei]NYI81571.1 nitrogen fixation-related uncharacterized protein [Saccharopolyspora hordei]